MLSTAYNAFPGYTIRIRGSWDEILGESLPQCDSSGLSVPVNLGAGWIDYLAPGFDYCLDAPGKIPTGCHQAATYANVWD